MNDLYCDVCHSVVATNSEITSLRQQLETERMRLAACGVVARANTPESADKAREMLPEYRSASCDDVARIVDSEMSLRQQLAEAKKFKKNEERYRWLRELPNADSLTVQFMGSDLDR